MLSHIAIQLQDIQWHDACLKFYIGDFFHKLRILSKPEQICVCVSMCHQQGVFFSSFFPIPQSLRELGSCLSYAIKLVKIESINLTEKKELTL